MIRAWNKHNLYPHNPGRERQLYIAIAPSPNVIKVGVSKNPPARMLNLEPIFGEVPRLIESFPVGNPVESTFHRLMKPYSLLGEWYSNDEMVFSAYATMRDGGLNAFLAMFGEPQIYDYIKNGRQIR